MPEISIMKTCSECGCPYDGTLSFCPECGAPNELSAKTIVAVANCPNCGAPVTNKVSCEYCESLLPKKEPQTIVVNNHEDDDSAGRVLGAALLGGLIGGIFGD